MIFNIKDHLPEYYFKEYETFKQQLKYRAEFAKEKLLQMTPFEGEKASPEFLINLFDIYKEVIFFPDDEIKSQMKKLGLKDSDLKWLISLSDIESQFDYIETKGFVVLKNNLIPVIYFYLSSNVLRSIQLATGYYVNQDDTIWNTSTKEIYEVFRRRDYAAKKNELPEDLYTLLMLGVIDEINQHFEEEKERKFFTDLFQGKIEKFLSNILECIINEEDLGENKNDHIYRRETKKMNASYELFTLICQDQTFPDRKDITNSRTTPAKVLRKFLYKK